jgi:hypothetical protein
LERRWEIIVMPAFVRDMHIQVHTPDGKTSVEAPPDANTGKFLDDLRVPLHLASKDAEGRRIHWHIYNRDDRKLDPNRTLDENGVGEGHDLFFRPESEMESIPEAPEEVIVIDKHKKEGERVLIRCDNGHFYDPKKNATCPYCGVAAAEPTVPKKKEPIVAAHEDVGSTRPAGGFSSAPDPGQSGDLTIRVGMGETRIDPVVGWLVCMHGPEKGKDYRIRSENNTIGRSDEMYISIKDDMVSRERHAYITFDPQTNKFYIRPGDARGLVHRNGNVVFQAEELHAYDQILLGQTKLVFVPLCGEHFKWE